MAVKAPPTTNDAPAACANGDPNDPATRGESFDFWGACATLTGEIDDNYQNNMFVSVFGGSNTMPSATETVSETTTLDTTKTTPIGAFTTDFVAVYQNSIDQGPLAGTETIQSWYGSLAGLTGGFTSSLMNFWSGDFLFFATVPNEAVGIVSYEGAITNNLKLAVAWEADLPSPQQASLGIRSITTTTPDVTARLRYVNDDGVTLHLSGLIRRADIPLPSGTTLTPTGWAASFGATTPFPVTGAKDTMSMQTTYAVNAVADLGTKADIAQNEAIGLGGPTRGWSIVGSLNHPWTEQLETNVFASYITVDVDLPQGITPSARATRLDANIYWKPVSRLRFGAEIGWVHGDIDADGAMGLPFSSVNAVVAFGSVKLLY